MASPISFYDMFKDDMEIEDALEYLTNVCDAIDSGMPEYDVWAPHSTRETHDKMEQEQWFEPEHWNDGTKGDLLIGIIGNTEELARVYGHFHRARANAAFIMLARTWLPKLVRQLREPEER